MTSFSALFLPDSPKSTRVRGKGSDEVAQNDILHSGGMKSEILSLDFQSSQGSSLKCKDIDKGELTHCINVIPSAL